MIKSVFFDFDGVIKNSVYVKADCFLELFNNESDSFQERIREHHLDNGGISRYEKLRLWLSWLDVDVTDSLVQSYAQRFSGLVVDRVVQSTFVPGALDVLRNDKISKFLITGTPTGEMRKILERLNLENVFKEVRGSEWSKESSVQLILDKYGLHTHECIFIGDALTDLKAAQSNGVSFFLRKTNYNENLSNLLEKQDYSSSDLILLNDLIR